MPLVLLELAAASVPTPPSGKVTFFLNADDGTPSFKDDTGTVTPVTTADPELAAIAGLTSAANKIPMFSGSGTATLLDFDVDDTLAADSDTRIPSQQAVKAYVDALVAGAPGALDTLNELAAALGDDANFASTVTTALAGKAALAGATFVGAVEVPDEAYDATGWNGNNEVPTKNAVRDVVEAIVSGAINLAVSIPFVIDGGGAEITTGIKGDVEIPFAGTITAVRLLADQTGDIVVDIWKDTYANFPPTDADSITASAVPTISGAVKSEDSTLTGWTTSVAAGDILRFNVDSVTDIERVTLSLTITRTS